MSDLSVTSVSGVHTDPNELSVKDCRLEKKDVEHVSKNIHHEKLIIFIVIIFF